MNKMKKQNQNDGVYKPCPVCKKHYMDLRLHVWSSHLDAEEKKGKIHKERDYSKIIKFIPKKHGSK